MDALNQNVNSSLNQYQGFMKQEQTAMQPAIDKFNTTVAAPKLEVTEQAKIPEAPQQGDFQKDSAGWLNAMAVLAAISGVRSRQHATTALGAFAAGVKGMKEGQQDAFNNAYKTWEGNTKAALDNNKMLMDKYKAIMDDRSLTETEAAQQIKMISSEFHDPLMFAADNYSHQMAIVDARQKSEFDLGIYDKKLQVQKQIWDEKNKPSMDEDAIKMSAKQLAAGDMSALTNVGRGTQGAANIAAIKNELASDPEMTGEKLAQIDLNYKKLQSEERTLGTQTAKMRTAGFEFDQLADQAEAASNKVDRGKYPSLNSILIAAEKGIGDENVIALAAAANGAVNTYARAINPSGIPRVSDQEKGMHLLDSAFSKGQFSAAIRQMKKETVAAGSSPGMVQEEINSQVSGTKSESKTSSPVNLIDKYGLEP